MRLAAVATLAVSAFLWTALHGSAPAADPPLPILTEVNHVNGVPRAAWTIPCGIRVSTIEVATSPERNASDQFRQANHAVGSPDLLRFRQTRWVKPPVPPATQPDPLPPGRYYVQIGTFESKPRYSNIMSFEIVAGQAGAEIGPGRLESCGGGGGGGGGGVGGKGRDRTAPTAKLSGPRAQDIDKLYVLVRPNEAGTVSATATVNVAGAAKVYSFKKVTRTARANVRVKLRLKMSRSKLATVKRALRRGRRLKAKVRVTAKDAAGNARTRKRTIRLRP